MVADEIGEIIEKACKQCGFKHFFVAGIRDDEILTVTTSGTGAFLKRVRAWIDRLLKTRELPPGSSGGITSSFVEG